MARSVALEVVEKKHPKVYELNGQDRIAVPIFNEDKEVDYVLDFPIIGKKPSQQYTTIYIAQGLGDFFHNPLPAQARQAWIQACKVYKEEVKRRCQKA